MRELNIIKHRWAFLGFSGVVVAAAIIAIIAFGFQQGIDFTGGTLWQIRIVNNAPTQNDLENVIHTELKIEDARVNTELTTRSFIIRFKPVEESVHRANLASLTARYPGLEELSYQSIGPSIGKELRTKALWALVLALVGISLYIAFAFRKVSRPISSWKYGIVTLVSLFHDVIIPAGLLALLGRIAGVEIDSNFIVALLVVMGFSVHDTIVVFDRIRETLVLDRGKSSFGEVINRSVNQTLARSVNTSLTLILVLIAMLVVGPHTLYYFILTLLVGVVTGIYSSIFVASPLLYVWERMNTK